MEDTDFKPLSKAQIYRRVCEKCKGKPDLDGAFGSYKCGGCNHSNSYGFMENGYQYKITLTK